MFYSYSVYVTVFCVWYYKYSFTALYLTCQQSHKDIFAYNSKWWFFVYLVQELQECDIGIGQLIFTIFIHPFKVIKITRAVVNFHKHT
jgi:hypothetical protein